MKITLEAYIKAKAAIEKTARFFTEEHLQILRDAEDSATCQKCSRVILCGVNKLCSDIDCGLKNGTKERQS